MGTIEVLTWAIVLFLMLPTVVVTLECLFALLPRRVDLVQPIGRRPRLAVLIPAHDEAAVIVDTLASVLPQLLKGDSVLVVADNCTDETVKKARAAGASVVERHDSKHQGKGFALAFGLDTLRDDPPEVLIMIDADCIASDSSLDVLARSAIKMDCPVQALNLMHASKGGAELQKIAEFAWLIKNKVRALGLSRIAMPCHLTGTGMAFPWRIIKDADLANGSIVEDMLLGLQLALKGHKAQLCPDAYISSYFPVMVQDELTQRRRWEHGHMSMIINHVPQTLFKAFCKRDVGLFFLGMDLMVPPLALQSMFLLLGLIVAAIAIPFGSFFPFWVLLVSCLCFVVALIVSWYRYARHIIGMKEVFFVPKYIFSKLLIYKSYVFSRELKWIRTGRGDNADD